ncbi:hypothetical protein pipiens_001198 [Culex pipiens pipiens]|uniref:Uncharacterized protein n=1 Tax=Culex pipiens pipiens TaxID=38569 RepID=A0ABD1DHB2_CULPP
MTILHVLGLQDRCDTTSAQTREGNKKDEKPQKKKTTIDQQRQLHVTLFVGKFLTVSSTDEPLQIKSVEYSGRRIVWRWSKRRSIFNQSSGRHYSGLGSLPV